MSLSRRERKIGICFVSRSEKVILQESCRKRTSRGSGNSRSVEECAEEGWSAVRFSVLDMDPVGKKSSKPDAKKKRQKKKNSLRSKSSNRHSAPSMPGEEMFRGGEYRVTVETPGNEPCRGSTAEKKKTRSRLVGVRVLTPTQQKRA